MKVKYSPIIGQCFGKLDQISFYDLNGQHIVRGVRLEEPIPSTDQLAVRAAYGGLVELFSNLDAEWIVAWNAAAELNEISPFNEYIKQNLGKEYADNAIDCTPDNDSIIGPNVTICRAYSTPGYIEIQWDDPGLSSDWRIGWVTRKDSDNTFARQTRHASLTNLGTIYINSLVISAWTQISFFFYNLSTGVMSTSYSGKVLTN